MNMINRRTLTITALALLIVTALALMAGALVMATVPTAARLNNRGNDDYARQAYTEALVDYQKAQISEPALAVPYYNAANALYRRGAYAEALEQLQVALSFTSDDELVGKGFFNLGNNFFNQEQMAAAVAAFREALLRDPADPEAKYNLELALQTQQEQEQQQEQEEQQNEQNQENQEANQGEDVDSAPDNQEQSEREDGQEETAENNNDEETEEQQADDEGQESEQNGAGQPQDGEQTGADTDAPAEIIDGQLTAEQAQQLLNAIAAEAQTLQEALGKILTGPGLPPVQDW